MHYLKLILRKTLARPLYPAISILGLVIGFVTVIFVTLWLKDEFNYDGFHENANRIYRLTVELENPETGFHWDFARSYYPWLKNIKDDIPGIDELVRLSRQASGIVRVEKTEWSEEIFYADSTVKDVFSLRFLEGDPVSCLSAPRKVILSESRARKFFGNNDPVGKTIHLYCSNCADQLPFEVTGIFRDFPPNAHLHFNILASFEKQNEDPGWAYYYLLLDKNTKPGQILSQFDAFAEKYRNPQDETKMTPALQKITDIHLNSSKERELEINGSTKQVLWIAGLAILILFITFFNFFNLRYIQLLKDYKTLRIMQYNGAKTATLMKYQFFESFFYAALASMVGLLIIYLLYPDFNRLMNKHADAGLPDLFTVSLTGLAALTLLFSLTGILPYLLLKASAVVTLRKRGTLTSAGLPNSMKGGRFRLLKSLVGIQYMLTFILLVSLAGEMGQLKLFMSNRLGSQMEKVVCVKEIPCQVVDKYLVFKQELLKSPLIEDVTSSMEEPGYEIMDMMGFDTSGVDDQASKKLLYVSPVDDNFFNFYRIKLVAGRYFDTFTGNDSIPVNYILNEKAVKYLGWTNEEALGKVFRLRNQYLPREPGRIVGVVTDFQPSSMKSDIKPYAFFRRSVWLNSAQVKVDTSRLAESIRYIKDTWDQLYPDFPFNYEFVEDMYHNVYKNEFQLKNLSLSLSILALILSSIGLFGITGMVFETRTKEIGIRKVNGARSREITWWLLKDIIIVVFAAILIGTPLAWLILKTWLQKFATRINPDPEIFILAGVVVLLIALLTVSFQTWRTASRNPVESLRYE